MSPILFTLTFFTSIENFYLSLLNPKANENSRSVKITWLPLVIYWPSVHLLLLLPVQSCDNNIFLQLFKIRIKF